MEIALHDLCGGKCPQNEDDLAEFSDKIWGLGTLSDIRKKVSLEVFLMFVGMNTIGNWKGDGWGGILENPEMVPHISDAMNALGLFVLGEAFRQVVDAFPLHTVFVDDSDYFDALNFLSNPRFKISNERLNQYGADERKQMSCVFKDRLNRLDELTEPLWGYDAPHKEGWGIVLDYMKSQWGNSI